MSRKPNRVFKHVFKQVEPDDIRRTDEKDGCYVGYYVKNGERISYRDPRNVKPGADPYELAKIVTESCGLPYHDPRKR